ncbi:GyrI-like small molecule binding domain protein [Leptospira ellinghausenii]|uniref:GyrI-like small molecule binding domain protein n=1 Tax=Leptospira ellinghausenii TaxID=1917822 RepID=A0A2P2DGP2_9LEPT|nr:GyrI-like domain-containing protein [Leptospira ellinghausenii]GBF43817.1 GyrI-like small molecule binding domain protein [Leptospira ellinghausenii]
MISKKDSFLYPIWEKLESNLSKEFALNELAFFSTYSPWHFHRLFSRFQSENVKDYVRRLRLEKAAFEIKTTSYPILEIALETGYTSQEAFTKAFRKTLGITPAAYRKKFQTKQRKFDGLQTLKIFGIERKDISIKKISSFHLLYKRHIGPYEEMPGFPKDLTFIQPFEQYFSKHNQDAKDQKWIGISQDDPDITDPNKIRFDIGIPVSSHTQCPNGLGLQIVQGGERLQIRVRLAYEKLPRVYDAVINEFFPHFYRRLANDAPFEVYLKREPKETPITDLYFALRD